MSDAFVDPVLKYEIGGKVLEMRPLPLKRLREALRIVEAAGAQLVKMGPQDPVAFVRQLPPILVGKFVELAPILFPNQELGEDWIESNMTAPQVRRVLEDAARLNDVTDFLVHLRGEMRLNPTETSQPEKA